MNRTLHLGLFGVLLSGITGVSAWWTHTASVRLANAGSAHQEVAYAAAADEGYCSADLKKILRRVLQSCGLLTSGEVRGCQPLEARNVATMSGQDFNALVLPLKERAGIIQFDLNGAELDAVDAEMLDAIFADQRGASYFFVVARASPEGSEIHNRALSERRGKAILDHLRERFKDPDLDREVGLLWLGEEFAQLDNEFCTWRRSGAPAGASLQAEPACSSKELNRSAFVAWIDCRI
jgi:outer membrane protein OmpA-like peptidoglycan-associated protein